MNIYENGFVKLDYDPATDILQATLPRVDNILYTEVRRSYDVIVEHVKSYDVRNLLVDASQVQVEVPEDIFTPIFADFVQGLSTSRLKKLARIQSFSIVREKVIKQTFITIHFPFQYEGFTQLTPALNWLKL